jgi:ribonuclease P protein component
MGSSGNACQRNANRSVTEMTRSNPTEPKIDWPASRLRRHADYQRVYQASRKQFAKQMSYFFALRPALGPDGTSVRGVSADTARVGLTVGKAMGNAVHRNRIRRRMREAVRRQLPLLEAPVDLVLHPRQSVLDLDFAALQREVAAVFRAVQKAVGKQLPAQTEPAKT